MGKVPSSSNNYTVKLLPDDHKSPSPQFDDGERGVDFISVINWRLFNKSQKHLY